MSSKNVSPVVSFNGCNLSLANACIRDWLGGGGVTMTEVSVLSIGWERALSTSITGFCCNPFS
jgi:hypothetical protein